MLLEAPESKELKGISMRDNDGVLYRGTEVVHWRDRMPDEYQVVCQSCTLHPTPYTLHPEPEAEVGAS